MSPPGGDFERWLEFEDALDFLERSLHGSVVVYAGLHSPKSGVYLAAALLPERYLTTDARHELATWNTDILSQGWGYGGGYNEDGSPDYALIPPFAWERPAILQHAIPIIWRRERSLEKGRPSYFEANPELTHVHDLHWVEGRSAYCTLDELGDIREVIRVSRKPNLEREEEITIEEDVLAKHMALGDYALVRFFDIDRYQSIEAAGAATPASGEAERIDRRGIHALLRRLVNSETTVVRAYIRGVQLVPPPRGETKRALVDDRRTDRKYASFIAHDFKHKCVVEVSCAPDELDSYFEDTGKPLQTTPAFFRREVLAKYQTDSDKYTVGDRHVSCRSTWSLRFDVNEVGQVHAYLCDLQHLPYPEQQYWRSFNEEPRAPISKRSFKTDFAGTWDLDPEPLRDLKARLREPIHLAISEDDRRLIWAPPPRRRTIEEVHYLAGESRKEWSEAIGALHRFVVEGLQASTLREIAEQIGAKPEVLRDLRSIKLLEQVLAHLDLDDDAVGEVVEPLKTLNYFRVKTSAHRTGGDAEELVNTARREHGDLAAHFKSLVRSVDTAIERLLMITDQHTGRV